MCEFVTMWEYPEVDVNKLQMKNFGKIAALRSRDCRVAISNTRKGGKKS